MKLTITNTFHNSSVNLIAKGSRLSASQVKRAEKELCGMSSCQCGSMWNYNHTDLGEGYEKCHFEPAHDGRTGILVGADICED